MSTVRQFPGGHQPPEPTPPASGGKCGFCVDGSNSYAVGDSRGHVTHWIDETCHHCKGSGYRLELNEPGEYVPGDVECLDCAGSGLASLNVDDGFFFRTDERDPNILFEAAAMEDAGFPVTWIDPPTTAIDWSEEVRNAVKAVEATNKEIGRMFARCAGRAHDRNARNGRPTPAQLAPLQEERAARVEWLAHCYFMRDGAMINEVAA